MPNDFVDLTGGSDDDGEEEQQQQQHHHQEEPVGVDICPDIEDLMDLEDTDDDDDDDENNDRAVAVAIAVASEHIAGITEHQQRSSLSIAQKFSKQHPTTSSICTEKKEGKNKQRSYRRRKRRKRLRDAMNNHQQQQSNDDHNIKAATTTINASENKKPKAMPRSYVWKDFQGGNDFAERKPRAQKAPPSNPNNGKTPPKPQQQQPYSNTESQQSTTTTTTTTTKKKKRERGKKGQNHLDLKKAEGDSETPSLPRLAKRQKRTNVEEATPQHQNESDKLHSSLFQQPEIQTKQTSSLAAAAARSLPLTAEDSSTTMGEEREETQQSNHSHNKLTGVATVLRVEAWDWLGQGDKHDVDATTRAGSKVGELKGSTPPSATAGNRQKAMEGPSFSKTAKTTTAAAEGKKTAGANAGAPLASNASAFAPKVSENRKGSVRSSNKDSAKKDPLKKRNPIIVEIPSDSEDDDDNKESTKQRKSRSNERAQSNDSGQKPAIGSSARVPVKEKEVGPSACRNFIVIEDSSDDDSDGDYIEFIATKRKADSADENNNKQASSTMNSHASSSSPNSFAKKPMSRKGFTGMKGFAVASEVPPNSFAKSPSKENATTKKTPLFHARPQHQQPDAFCRERDFDYKLSQEAALEMQERLFRESVTRVRSRETQHSLPANPFLMNQTESLNAPTFLSDPILDIYQRYPGHWKWRNPYARLGLPNGASLELTKKHYRKLALIYHPDKRKFNDSSQRFQAITAAYRKLTS